VRTVLASLPRTDEPIIMAKKRSYRRRSDEERIAELESKIEEQKRKIALRERQDSPVLKDIPGVRRRLQSFAQLAIDHGREDLSNMTMAFLAGLERAASDDGGATRRRGRRPAE